MKRSGLNSFTSLPQCMAGEEGEYWVSLRRHIKIKRTVHMCCRYIYDDITAFFDDDRKVFDIVNSAIRRRLETLCCHSGILQGHPTETRYNCEETWGFIKCGRGVDLWKFASFELKMTQWTWTNKFMHMFFVRLCEGSQVNDRESQMIFERTNKRRSFTDE